MTGTGMEPKKEMEFLRRRNTELRVQAEYYKIVIRKLIAECRNWQQVSIAAIEKAKQLEE